MRRTVSVLIAAAGVAGTLAFSGTAAHAASANYWQETGAIDRGSCGATTKLAPGVYTQVCLSVWKGLVDGTYQAYTVVTNTGTAKQYVHVPSSTLRRVDPDESYALTGCYTTTIYANQSLTCASQNVGFRRLLGSPVTAYAEITLEVTGNTYHLKTPRVGL